MIYFISFGSDRRYEELSCQIIRDLSSVYRQSFSRIFTADDLPASFIDYASRYRRGFGYWIWKPWIVRRTLGILRPNDVVLYCDGRCGMANKGGTIRWFDEFLQRTEFDVAAWQMRFVEKHWTTADLLSRVSSQYTAAARETGQFAATFHAWRVNGRSMRLASLWLEFMARNPALCRDEPSRLPNDAEFKENRHDQSVFSLTLKSLRASNELSVLTFNNSHIYSDNLLPHQKQHPS